MPRPRFQFRLRTLFVVVTALSVLLAQWPLIERGPARYRAEPSEFFDLHSPKVVIDRIYPVWVKVGEGPYYVPARVVVIGSVEAAALIGWLLWRRVRWRGLHTTQGHYLRVKSVAPSPATSSLLKNVGHVSNVTEDHQKIAGNVERLTR